MDPQYNIIYKILPSKFSEAPMDQFKLNFVSKRGSSTKKFFKESRIMTEKFPDKFSPERPYDGKGEEYEQYRTEARHVYKLIGSLY